MIRSQNLELTLIGHSKHREIMGGFSKAPAAAPAEAAATVPAAAPAAVAGTAPAAAAAAA